jgi:hypothetical protein
MALYDKRISQGVLGAQRMEAITAGEQMESIVLSGSGAGTGGGTGNSMGGGTSMGGGNGMGCGTIDGNSELSTVSSSRYLGLEEY